MSRHDHAGRDLRPGKAVQENNWRGVRYVQINVVERRIIQKAIAAAEDRLAVTGEEPAPLWRVGKAKARPKAGLGGIQFWEDARRQWNVLAPEGGGRIGLALRGQIIEQVRRLPVVGPGQAEVQGQIGENLPVIACIEERVMLAEVERRRSGGDTHAIRLIGSKRLPVTEAECTVQVGEKCVRRALVGVVHTGFESVPAQHPVQVVLALPGIDDASFRKRSVQAEGLQGGITECNTCDGLSNVYVRRHGAERIGGKGNVQTVEAYTN